MGETKTKGEGRVCLLGSGDSAEQKRRSKYLNAEIRNITKWNQDLYSPRFPEWPKGPQEFSNSAYASGSVYKVIKL